MPVYVHPKPCGSKLAWHLGNPPMPYALRQPAAPYQGKVP